MNIEDFREYCLSFEGVHEKMPFPNVADRYSRDVLCFYVLDKWFCFVNIEIFDFCCIKCNPEESGELQNRYVGIKPGWHMNKKYWISVYFNQDVPDAQIKELVRKSYDIVVKSLTKKERGLLQSGDLTLQYE
ncbi:MmcQ/YjbR family DNA-binding protein [Bacteroides sp. AM16-24]|jgi:predicted DNA-binding protein (MmcQ/YjbR family)|uniref:MmcQ/YjbR family DNA-binding protein n=1 Tax=Bacteroides sp. AM16-24 TaxID=2292002 RepID=UPI000E4CF7EE|nr:MmcQ/YjbR family DNA-binding protein [Bacteroides sp. AM16-24]RHI10665.1 MmcQ/YjbR family DNA-binding protein [Bacteroides sp. AM16-24]